KQLELAGAEVVNYQETIREKIVSSIADPNIGFILLVLGALGIYAEFSAPGMVAPGVIGGILALLGLSSLSVLPINWTGAALLLLALACFVLEAKYPAHGILAVGGAVSMILGALLLINGPPDMRIHFATALSVTLPFALITTFLVSLVLRAQRNKVMTGESGLLDEIGVAHSALRPEGTIFVHGEYWNAVSSSIVEAGSPVRVVAVDGLTLRVIPENRPEN
ncbi:MAG: NfeD family protein, partial [Bryobacteraceae bacterium]